MEKSIVLSSDNYKYKSFELFEVLKPTTIGLLPRTITTTHGIRISAMVTRTTTIRTITTMFVVYENLKKFLKKINMITLQDIFQAYFDCRKNKRKTQNAINFELDYEARILKLYDDIINKKYKTGKSIAFLVEKPCLREIFAGDFRDRIVHHLIYNKINHLFEKEFIYDSYSCRVGKGVLFGTNRATSFMRKISDNYKKTSYVMKLDISGFFMSIDKNILYNNLSDFLQKKYLEDDLDIILYLTKEIIFNDPTINCILKTERKKWDNLPKHKSLFFTKKEAGLPIGNLTSQIFGNFYLNKLDHFIKNDLGVKYYGRYVDDMIFFENDILKLKYIKTEVEQKLNELNLCLNHKKTYLQTTNKGVLFLGTYILPYRNYIGKRTKGSFYNFISQINDDYKKNKEKKDYRPGVNSYLGTLKYSTSYNLRKKMLLKIYAKFFNHFYISSGYSKISLKKKIVSII